MMDILALVSLLLAFAGLYFLYLVFKLLRLACKALQIYINQQLYGRSDDYAGYYERKRDDH